MTKAPADHTESLADSIRRALDRAEQQGLIVSTGGVITPTVRGFDFLSDLQALFLPPEAGD